MTSFQNTVIETTAHIEQLLCRLCEQAGKESISDVMQEIELRQLGFIVTVRYEIIDGNGVKIKGDEQRFIRTSDWLIKRLEEHLQAQAETPIHFSSALAHERSKHFSDTSHRQANRFITFGGGTLCLLLFRLYWTQTVERGGWSHSTVEEFTDLLLAAFAALLSITIMFYTSALTGRRRY